MSTRHARSELLRTYYLGLQTQRVVPLRFSNFICFVPKLLVVCFNVSLNASIIFKRTWFCMILHRLTKPEDSFSLFWQFKQVTQRAKFKPLLTKKSPVKRIGVAVAGRTQPASGPTWLLPTCSWSDCKNVQLRTRNFGSRALGFPAGAGRFSHAMAWPDTGAAGATESGVQCRWSF